MPHHSKKSGSSFSPVSNWLVTISSSAHFWPIVLLAILTGIFFYQVTLGGQVLFFGDNLSLRLPSAIYGWQRISQGQLPLWNPHIFIGMPYLADISNAIFYPLSLFYLFLSPLQALTYQTIASIFISGLFTYLYCHALRLNRFAALSAAISYMFCSTLIHYTSYANLLGSSVWLPLTLLALHQSFTSPHRYWWLLTSISLSLQITAGHPQPVYYTALLMAGYTLCLFPFSSLLNRLATLALILIASLGLTAAVLIPSLELTNLSTRSQINYPAATLDSLHPALLVRFLLPSFFDQPQLGMTWGPAWRHISDNRGYLGIVSLVLISLGWPLLSDSPYRRYYYFFIATSLIAIILALGNFTPIYHLLFNYLPGLNHFRGPAESLLVLNFSVAFLTGISLHILSKSNFHLQPIIKYYAPTVLLVLISFVIANFYFDQFWHAISVFHTLARDQIIFTTIVTDTSLALLLSLATLILIHYHRPVFFLGLIFVDLYLHNASQVFTISPQTIDTSSIQAHQLQRLLTPADRFISNQDLEVFTGLGNYWENMTIRPPFADSYYTPQEKSSAAILNTRLQSLALDWNLPYHLSSPNGYSSFLLTRYLDYLDGQVSSLPQNSPPVSAFTDTKLDELSVRYLLTPTGIIPRGSTLPRARVIYSGQATPAQILLDQPEHLSILAQATSASQLVLADSYYPGWQAKVDGQPATIIPYQQAFRSLQLSPGTHQIEFTFKPRSWYLGSRISLITLLTITIYFWIIRHDLFASTTHHP